MPALYFPEFTYCLICFPPPRGIHFSPRDDWQTTKKGKKKRQFSALHGGTVAETIPLPPRTQLRFGSKQGKNSLCLASPCVV